MMSKPNASKINSRLSPPEIPFCPVVAKTNSSINNSNIPLLSENIHTSFIFVKNSAVSLKKRLDYCQYMRYHSSVCRRASAPPKGEYAVQPKTNRHQDSLIHYYLPSVATLDRLSTFFSVFSDPARIKILTALSLAELCVTDLARHCCMQQSTVSHQLALLRRQGFVTTRRDGKVIYYSIASPYVARTLEIGADFLHAKP